jgi:hypothetical protein
MLTIVIGLCCVSFINPMGVVSVVRRQRLATLLDLTEKVPPEEGQNSASESLCFK